MCGRLLCLGDVVCVRRLTERNGVRSHACVDDAGARWRRLTTMKCDCLRSTTTCLLRLCDLQHGAREIDPDRPLKEQAVEAILVRWQYAGIPWDPLSEVRKDAAGAGASSGSSAHPAPPSGFLELPGFAGVYIGVREDVIGTLLDKRPESPRPSFAWLVGQPSSVLKSLWRTALEKQREDLIKHEVGTSRCCSREAQYWCIDARAGLLCRGCRPVTLHFRSSMTN